MMRRISIETCFVLPMQNPDRLQPRLHCCYISPRSATPPQAKQLNFPPNPPLPLPMPALPALAVLGPTSSSGPALSPPGPHPAPDLQLKQLPPLVFTGDPLMVENICSCWSGGCRLGSGPEGIACLTPALLHAVTLWRDQTPGMTSTTFRYEISSFPFFQLKE